MATRENILVVDDKPDNLRLLSNILTVEGYKVRKVLNGRLAVDAARLDPPDLILLDIMMPDPDGYQVCHRLKASPQTETIPVIFLSALDTVTDKVKAFQVGGVDYITKPFQQEEVLARVKTHLQIRKLTQTLQEKNSLLEAEIDQRQKVEVELKKTLRELRNTQEQIIVKEKLAALGAMMAGIAHELRNPLNFVNNYAEGSVELIEDVIADINQSEHLSPALLDRLNDELAEIHDNAIAIHQHGQRAERIIHNMMQHTRADSSDRRCIDLNQLLEEAIELAYQGQPVQLDRPQVTFETDYDATIEPIEVSPSDLSRAFINLIDNACYAVFKRQRQADDRPTVRITTQRLLDQIQVKIRDNGIGISSEVQKKIFDPFFTTKANEGTGLGLSIAYDVIVRQHQGSLTVTSEINIYTEFTAILPTAVP